MLTGLIIVLAAGIVGYLLGSIPVGMLVCRLYGVDIRTVGSGRTGGTNAWRAVGLKAAIPTILGDAGKGALAVLLVNYVIDLWFPSLGSLTKELPRPWPAARPCGATTGPFSSSSRAAPGA